MKTLPLSYNEKPHDHCHPHKPGEMALDIRDLSAGYPDTGLPALRGLSLTLEPGKRMALVGPNGAGKSTLLKAIVGVIKPRAGSVSIFGEAAGTCHHIVSYLSQRGEVDWRFPISVRRLALTGRYVHLGWFRRPGSEDRRIVDDVLDRLGIAALADRQISELSGGQQQRVLLARALAQKARLLLLDEPLNAVDQETRAVLTDVLDKVQAAGTTIVIATHDHGRLDKEFDEVVYLYEGRRVTQSAEIAAQDCCEIHATHSPHAALPVVDFKLASPQPKPPLGSAPVSPASPDKSAPESKRALRP